MATATVHASQTAGQVVAGDDVGSALGHATRVSPATVSSITIRFHLYQDTTVYLMLKQYLIEPHVGRRFF